MTKTLNLQKLDHIISSDCVYRHLLNRAVVYTKAVRYLAMRTGGFFLVEQIGLMTRHDPAVARERFQVWKFVVRPDGTATLTCRNSNGDTVYILEMDFTRFPLPEITFWAIQNGFGEGTFTIMLPSE